MSDNWLLLVPTDPRFKPTAEAAMRAQRLLAAFVPQAEEVKAVFKEDVAFFDVGGNWSGVQCSACGADAEPWWPDAMDEAWSKQLNDLDVIAACCGARVSLNELHYEWPCAFGSFALEAMNPNIGDLPAHQETQLAECVGCSLRKVWRRL